ncbi:hypothetical protein [Archaeoglobus sp.]
MVERMRDPEEVVGEWLDFVALWIFAAATICAIAFVGFLYELQSLQDTISLVCKLLCIIGLVVYIFIVVGLVKYLFTCQVEGINNDKPRQNSGRHL